MMRRITAKLAISLGVTIAVIALNKVLGQVLASQPGLDYFGLLTVLEPLEHIGLPTLTGSESGWPVPTPIGVACFVALIFALSCGLVFGIDSLRRSIVKRSKPNHVLEGTAR